MQENKSVLLSGRGPKGLLRQQHRFQKVAMQSARWKALLWLDSNVEERGHEVATRALLAKVLSPCMALIYLTTHCAGYVAPLFCSVTL